MALATDERIAIAVLAKAPIAGFVKTRLVSTLGAEGAAALQERLIERTVETAHAAHIGPVTIWTTPAEHPFFAGLRARYQVSFAPQPDGDLGARMLAACAAADGPALVIGTDCPLLMPAQLRLAAQDLRAGIDVVVFPAE